MFKAIVVGVRERVALSLVRRSLPSRGTGQAGRTNKECESVGYFQGNMAVEV